MKFLSVIAASLAAFSAAQKQQQKPSSFRGAQKPQQKPSWGGMKDQYNQQKDKWSQQKGGQYGKNKGSQQKGGQYGKSKGKCSVANIPEDMQDTLTAEFKALDVDGNNYLDPKEFEGEEAKITDAFKSYRKGKKPSWYKGRGGRGGRGDDSQNGDSGRPGRGGKGRGGDRQDGGKDGGKGRVRGGRSFQNKPNNRRLANEPSKDFWKYLQQNGFKHKSQDEEDKEDAGHAGQVFLKFDRDNNTEVSLCEFETAMYRTKQLQEKMGIKPKDDIVVVSDH